jgi:hypothetical protein
MIKNVTLSSVHNYAPDPLPALCSEHTGGAYVTPDTSPKQLVSMLLLYSGYAPAFVRYFKSVISTILRMAMTI